MTIGPETLERYLRALLEENQRINLTAVRDLAAARVLHVLDSLAIQGLAQPDPPATCLDLGSGNGFPGVALRVVYPQCRVTLLDKTRKKLLAIERVLASAQIEGIETVHVDAAQAPRTHPALLAHFDLVTARAVADPHTVGQLASPFLTSQGRLVLWLDAQTTPPPELAGVQLVDTLEYDLPEPAARHRRLACYQRG